MTDERRVALVTGAAQGIGKRIALELADRGYAVALNDVQDARETLHGVEELGAESLLAPGDVADEGAVMRMVQEVLERWGRVDLLVNNAGLSLQRRAEDMTLADWQRILDITNRVPMARFATPDDIAQAVAFLADPGVSGFVNGQCLTVDGGWTADAGWESLRLSHR